MSHKTLMMTNIDFFKEMQHDLARFIKTIQLKKFQKLIS